MTLFKQHHELKAHHRYQLEIIFLFVFGIFLFVPYHATLLWFEKDTTMWQWYFFFPWMIFYTLFSLRVRSKIPRAEKQDPLKRPIGHWILLGLALAMFHLGETPNVTDLVAIDLSFGIFSIFLADSYWDFKKGWGGV